MLGQRIPQFLCCQWTVVPRSPQPPNWGMDLNRGPCPLYQHPLPPFLFRFPSRPSLPRFFQLFSPPQHVLLLRPHLSSLLSLPPAVSVSLPCSIFQCPLPRCFVPVFPD